MTVDEVRLGLRYLIKDGLAAQIMLTLTSGVFLVAFALNLGASNFVIGLLAAIPPMTQLVQIPSIYLVERIRERRKISVLSYSLSRFFIIFIILIPLLFRSWLALYILVFAILFNSVFNAVGGCSLNSWIHDFVPRRRLGTFFSRRLSLSWGISIPIGLAAGFFLDQWKQTYPDHALKGYSILFSGGLLMAVLSVYYLSRIPEPRMSNVERGRSLRDILLQPFHYPNFRHLIFFLGPWNFAVNLAAPFFTVYMLQRLQLNLRQWDFLFFMAFFLGLYSLHRLTVVKEEGEVKEKIALREMIWEIARPMRILSSIAGLRQLIQFPFSILRQSVLFNTKTDQSSDKKDE